MILIIQLQFTLYTFIFLNLRVVNPMNLCVFEEAHLGMPLKEYIRKWSNWVIDFHWIFTLKYFIDFLPTNKLLFFIKNYPSLDNFILHWMWWSYTLNKDLERLTKDPFRAVGTIPWLIFDIKNENHAKIPIISDKKNGSINKKNQEASLDIIKDVDKSYELKDGVKFDQNTNKFGKLSSKPKEKQPSKFFQYNEVTINTICSLLFEKDQNNDKQFYDKKTTTKYLKDKSFRKKLIRSFSYSSTDDIKKIVKPVEKRRRYSENLDTELKFTVS